MEGSGILRLVALFYLLALGFHDSAVNAGKDSTTHLSTKPRTFTEPSTLRDLLDVLGKLNESDIKDQLIEKLQDRIKAYLKPTGIFRSGIKSKVGVVLGKTTKLRKKILKDPDHYGRYLLFNPCEEYIDYYVDLLITWLPVLHSELWFLYFQTSWECRPIGGGWRGGQRFGQSRYTTHLHRWLTDQLDRTTVPYIPKGFSGEDLHERSFGFHIAAKTGIYFNEGGGPLNHAQYGLFLLSHTWHDSNLGSAVRFLREFCREIRTKKFDSHASGSTIEPLKPACEVLSKDLKSLSKHLWPLYGRSSDKNPYKGQLRPEAFSKYLDWLQTNLAGIIDTLRRMSSKMSRWTKDTLYNCEYSGPFKYGFVFRDKKWESKIKDKLPSALTALIDTDTGSLSIIYKLLMPRPAHVPSQTVHVQPPLANQPPTTAGTYTLRDLLDILGILSGTVIKSQVIKEVDRNLQSVLTLGGIPGESVEGVLTALIDKIPELRNVLLKDPDQYGTFSRFNPYEDSIDYYADILIQWLPVLHSELWFLYYHTAEECRYIGGGTWHNQNFGQSHGTTQLHRWLISKGFEAEELHDGNVGSDIAAKTGIYFNEGGLLNYAQYGLFLLSPTWHDTNLASAVLFLQEFCQRVQGKKFDSHASANNTDALTSVCEAFSMGFALLTDILHPLYDGSMDTYRGRLKAEAFPKYVDWLGRNLGSLKGSLGQMLSEASLWTGDMFNKASSPGPFRYGFVFKDPKWERSIQVKQPTVLFALTGQASMPPSGIRQCRISKASS